MEEVLAHMHLGPIVPDVLTRQHEHRSGLIWSGDRETSITDLQCRHFGRNLFQAYSGAPRRYFNQHLEDAQNCLHLFLTKVFDKFLRMELKSRDHKVTIYNLREGIYIRQISNPR
ncbi:hypothetical protein M9H77_01907 [Catharanthus roseus]|uniref:Uncharacterized protein n=1 Tax=Catharanthus roseus TaxID=4058 RepID=A0ACC0C723_CATRO|nr:hypothetical protein M9H77_01907 [Catharanthus roseus]